MRTASSPRFLAYALADAFGVFCTAVGSSWFFAGKGALLADFPHSLAEAVAATAGGIAVMIWAMHKMLLELRHPPR